MSTLVRQKYNGPVGGALRRVVKRAGKFISNKPSRTQVVLRNKLEVRDDYFELVKSRSHRLTEKCYGSVEEIRRKARTRPLLAQDTSNNLAGCSMTGALGMLLGIGFYNSENKDFEIALLVLGPLATAMCVFGVLRDPGYQNFRSCQKLVKELDRQQPFAHVYNPREYVSTIEQSLNVALGDQRQRFAAKWNELQGWKQEFEKKIEEVNAADANIFGGESEKKHVLASLDHRFKEIESTMSEFEAQCLKPLEELKVDLIPVKMAQVEARVLKYETDLAQYDREQDLKEQRAEMQEKFAKLGLSRDLSRANKSIKKPEFTVDDILSAFDEELDAYVDARRDFLKGSYGKPAGNGRLFQNGEVTLSSDEYGTLSVANKKKRQTSERP